MKVIVLMLLLLSITALYGEKAFTLPQLEKPDSIAIHKNHVYFSDQGSIFMYTLSDLSFVKSFGKAGEGPAEFKIKPKDNIGVRFVGDGNRLMVNSMAKLSYFDLKGTFIKEQRNAVGLVITGLQFFKPLGTDQLVGFNRVIVDKQIFHAVNLYKRDTLEKGKELYKQKYQIQFNNFNPLRLGIIFLNGKRRGPAYYASGNKIVAEGNDDDIYVFDNTGKQLLTIDAHKKEKFAIPDAFKKRVMAYLEKRMPTAFVKVKQKGKFPDYFPLRYMIVDDGLIYVLTYKYTSQKNFMYIMDLNGKLQATATVPFEESQVLCAYPYTIHKGTFYQLRDNEESEEWEFCIRKITKAVR